MLAVLLFVSLTALLALGFVVYLVFDVLRHPRGNSVMRLVSDAVQTGASAFLRREYFYIAIFVAVLAGVITTVPLLIKDPAVAVGLGWQTAVSFVIGALASAAAGFIGMNIATRANSRTAEAARRGVEDLKSSDAGLRGALAVAISGGAVMGLSVVGIGLLGLVLVILVFNGFQHPGWVNGYAMGASLVALFARSGGGIFTKGADMGADLVGKVEAGIPEDDPRNAATIADNVGDNVGDVAGLGADLMESYIEAMTAAMALAAAGGITGAVAGASAEVILTLQLLPLVLAAVGILASIVGIAMVKFLPSSRVQASLMNATYASAGVAAVGTFIACYMLVPAGYNITARVLNGTSIIEKTFSYGWMGLAFAAMSGIVAGAAVGFFSEYYTSARFRPVRRMAEKSRMGPALTVTDGLAVGMKSTFLPIILLGLAMLASFHFAHYYGIALAALGMLMTTGMVVAVDSYGPIADNAGGCAEMAKLDHGVRDVTDSLDSVGNTTAAIGKGFAIGSAAFACMGLLVAYMAAAGIAVIDLSSPGVLFGLLLGGVVPFLFAALLFDAVSHAAFRMIDEVRRQLREIPGIMLGTHTPDYARCVTISTDGAIRGMLLPGSLAIVLPPVVGITLGGSALAGFLVGALITGMMLGLMCATSGGAMDNAKKHIEAGHLLDGAGVVQGKGSDAHKAAVIGDTVGDPLKDTVGPSLNILIKLMAVIALVMAPLLAVITPLVKL